MTAIQGWLRELKAQRARLDEAITSLEKLQATGLVIPPLSEPKPKPQGRPKRKRQSKPKPDSGKPANGSMPVSLTCMECKPARTFDTAIGLAQHNSWRHTGRKGTERSLQPSTLQG